MLTFFEVLWLRCDTKYFPLHLRSRVHKNNLVSFVYQLVRRIESWKLKQSMGASQRSSDSSAARLRWEQRLKLSQSKSKSKTGKFLTRFLMFNLAQIFTADWKTKTNWFKLKSDTLIQIKDLKFSFKILFWIVTKSSPTLVQSNLMKNFLVLNNFIL